MKEIQRYMSSDLTHFIGRSLLTDQEQFELMIKIIRSGIIETRNNNRKGAYITRCAYWQNLNSNEMFIPDMVCFCDIPITECEIHMQKYSNLGISFKKEFLIKQGVRPVLYIPSQVKLYKTNLIDELRNNLIKFHEISVSSIFPLELQIFFDLHFFSFIKVYDSAKSDEDPENYYFEREWRGLERIEFTIEDISRIILPAKFIRKFFEIFPNYNAHITTV